ncbi:transglutaminase domain-containing protein [Flavisericum labens]|uniref:transglutaminase domain-containing protein n=1 Tax=Flavisericum labens TaxID=3377112 RepID=UPI00387AE461
MKTTTLFFMLCFSISAFSQNYKFGKISKEELQEKFYPLDSSSAAAFLHKERLTYIKYRQGEGWYMQTDVHERVKIYNNEGFDYATKQINLHVSNNEEENISGIKGSTYNLVGNKIEDTKLDKQSIFKTELSKFRNQVKLTMPNIKEGCVIEYKYSIISPFYWYVDDYVFQHDIPIKNLHAKFESPEYFNFKINSKGYFPVKPVYGKKRGVVRFRTVTRASSSLSGGSASSSINNSEFDFILNTTTYDLSDVPALKDEPYVNNINNYRSTIEYELSYTNFPQSPLKYYATTWEDVVKTIYKSDNFGKELDRSGYFEGEIDALTAGASSPMEKAALVYNFVKSHMSWNGYYGKFTDEGVKKAFQAKTGNIADINLMLTAMLRYVGLNANPVLVSTRHNGVPLFPTIDGYNYVITAIESPQGILLLDATNPYGVPNILPVRVLNWEGRIVRKNKSSSTINLYPKQKSKNAVTMMVSLSDSGVLEGNIRSIRNSHFAMSYRTKYFETDPDQFLEKLENRYGGIEIYGFEVKNDKDLSKPVMESYKFSLESQADIINDKIYFSPLFFLRSKENPFKLEKREFPVDFSYPISKKYMVIVNLPEGYKVESVPEPAAMMLPDNLGAFKYNLQAKDAQIQIIVEEEINQAIISPIYYDALKAYFSKLIEKESEQIVLTKA